MTKEKKVKGGGAKLSRSETVTVRLDPKLRYVAEIGARSQRRTLSSFIEWAIEESLKSITLFDGRSSAAMDVNLAEATADLWDVDEADRFAKLALQYPELMTYEEQVIWKVITEHKDFWKGVDDSSKTLDFTSLRFYWDLVKSYAAGEISYTEFKDGLIPY